MRSARRAVDGIAAIARDGRGRRPRGERARAALDRRARRAALPPRTPRPRPGAEGEPPRPERRGRTRALGVPSAFAFGLLVGVAVAVRFSGAGGAGPAAGPAAPRVPGAAGRGGFSRVSFVAGDAGGARREAGGEPERAEAGAGAADAVEDGYWGAAVERALPVGFGEESARSWRARLATATATRLEPGCGRMQNRLMTLSDGGRACVRYRQNADQIQGEMFSFYLARTLNLTNLAPSAAALFDGSAALWRGAAADAAAARWSPGRAVVVAEHVGSLEPAPIPEEFRPGLGGRLDAARVAEAARAGADASRLAELAQWSDLIAFDYLTANLDRVVNNLYNFQWNANIMEAPAHNLARRAGSRLLVFLDNESGLLHGYRLLHKYETYHGALLAGACVFRRATADALRALHRSGDAGARLNALLRAHASPELLDALPPLPPRTCRTLQERLARLVRHIDDCRASRP